MFSTDNRRRDGGPGLGYSTSSKRRNPDKLVTLTAESAGWDAGNYAVIKLNDQQIRVQQNENGHYRGLHIVALDPERGEVLAAQAFDTYVSSALFDQFISRGIPQGTIILAACKDECVSKLSDRGRQFFADMGSEEIWNLAYRSGFSFVGTYGRR